MSITNVLAVFDIGKTNKKFLLFNQDFDLVYQHEQKFITSVDEDGFECDDIAEIQSWIQQSLTDVITDRKFAIEGVNFSTYGASLAFLDRNGSLLAPIYNYLKGVSPNLQQSLFSKYKGQEEFCRNTASPALGNLLNAGIQILWLQQAKKSVWNKVEHILHFPQYLSFLLTHKIVSEPTSIGCHTFLWDFDNKNYHPWVQEGNLKLPEPISNTTTFDTQVAGKDIKVGIGIHDSSASLVPYLATAPDPFILVSTGTWCISMNPFNSEPLTSDQLAKDCLCYLTPDNQQVKSARLFMGHFHDECLRLLNAYFDVDPSLFKSVAYDSEKITALKEKFGEELLFFPKQIEHFEDGLKEIEFSNFNNFKEAYTRLIIELSSLCIASLRLIIPLRDTTKVLYVSGGFSRNEIFVMLLAEEFSDKKVYTSEIDNASALGAALVMANNFDNFNVDKVSIVSN